MQKLKKLTKQFFVNLMIFSLLQTSLLPSKVFASAQDMMGLAQGAMGIYSQYLGQKQQMVMQQMMSARNQQMMQQLSPYCKKPDGTACYSVGGKLFPECKLPASMSQLPQNICENPTPDPMQISQMMTYEAISKGWVNYYEQMSNDASNANAPSGLKCLEDKKKAVESQITEMVNNLTRLQDLLNKDKEAFRANNKKILEELATANDELFGSAGLGKNNLDIKTKDFTKSFSKSCIGVLGSDFEKASQLGFDGLQKTLIQKNIFASDYNQNRNLIEADVRRDIEKIQANLAESGFDDWSSSWQSGSALEASKFASVNSTIAKQNADFQTAKARIAKELKGIGYELPPMDKNFSVDFDEFIAGSSLFFKTQYINNCISGNADTGIAFTPAQIASMLSQQTTTVGNTAQIYGDAINNILNSDASVESKLEQIRILGNTYTDVVVRYKEPNGNITTESPYELYQKMRERCEVRFTQNDQLSAKGSNGVSQMTKVSRGKKLLEELKGLHDSFSTKLGQKVLEKVMNCEGESKKAGSSCGDKSSFDPGNGNFCMSQANQCANEVQGCYAEANKHVETRKLKMKNLATAYNANASSMITRSNQLYEQQKVAVMNMVKMIQTQFPGTNFEIPQNMFVSTPEMKKDSFGIDLANDGHPAFMDELPKKIDLLKKMFRDQQKRTSDVIADYISKQRDAMEKNRGKWEQIAERCKDAVSTSIQELAKQNAEGQRAQDELDRSVASFCRKYSALSENPMAACDDAKDLAEDMDKIQSRLTHNSLQMTRQFKNACNQFNNEANGIPDYCEDMDDLKGERKKYCERKFKEALGNMNQATNSRVKKVTLSSLCGAGDEINSDSQFVKAAVSKLSEEDKKDIGDVSTLKEAIEQVETHGIDDGDFFSNIKQIMSQYDSSDSSSSICKKLRKLKDDKAAPAPAPVASAAATTPPPAGSTPATTTATTAVATAPVNDQAKIIEVNQELLDESLKALTPIPPSLRDQQMVEVQRIGEQADGSCDAQASNINMPKMPGFNLQDFDNNILGTAR